MGKPIITTDFVGRRDVVKEGVNGFLVLPKNVKSLSGAMIKMVEMAPEERAGMSRRTGKKPRRSMMRELSLVDTLKPSER